jgi:hypothetical protein
VCPDCGGPQSAATCLERFHALLAFENEHPPAFGAVHHLTVACYYLQHPRGYTREALEMWRTAVADCLSGRVSVQKLRRKAKAQFEGAKRVREPDALPPSGWPTTWLKTLNDVIAPGESLAVAEYIDRAMTWAKSVDETLSVRVPLLPRR